MPSQPTSFARTVFGTAAFAVGAAVALALFPLDMMLGRWSWAGLVPGDIAASQIGYMYFALDNWRWPLFHTVMLDPPEGVNIVFTDPVPVLALFGKIIFKLTGFMPLYIGPWILACYGLQSLVSYLIFRRLGLRQVHALAASPLLVVLPSFIFRFGHIALMGQFIVLLTFLFYLRAVSSASRREMALVSAGVGGIVFFNPYLLAMSAPVIIAGLAEAARRGRARWREIAAFVLLMFLVAGGLAFIFGIIGTDPLPRSGGFGHYSLNLLSPLTPQFSVIAVPPYAFLDETGGQYEGFNYLGAGVLLLLFSAVVLRFRAIGDLLARHPFLAAVLVGLTLFAASNRVWIGPIYLGNLDYDELPVINVLTSTFRSSGRFFWPVAFVLVITSVVLLARSGRYVLPLILGAVVIQVIDITPILMRSHQQAKVGPIEDLTNWQAAMREHDELVLFPKHHCADIADRHSLLSIQLQAARRGIPTNGAYLNRGNPACAASALQVSDRMDAHAVTANPLIVLFKNSYAAALLSEAAEGFFCRETRSAFVCSRQEDSAVLRRLGTDVGQPNPIPLGSRLTIGKDGTGKYFMAAGFEASTESKSLWGEGPASIWAARLPRTVCKSLTFQADINPLSMGDYAVRRAKVVLNGKDAGEIVLSTPGPQNAVHRMALGGECIDGFRFELRFNDVRSPKDLGMNEDMRQLTWRYTSYAFDAE